MSRPRSIATGAARIDVVAGAPLGESAGEPPSGAPPHAERSNTALRGRRRRFNMRIIIKTSRRFVKSATPTTAPAGTGRAAFAEGGRARLRWLRVSRLCPRVGPPG